VVGVTTVEDVAVAVVAVRRAEAIVPLLVRNAM
jgi:hypothetical protein